MMTGHRLEFHSRSGVSGLLDIIKKSDNVTE